MNTNDLFRAFEDIDDDILERSEATVSRRVSPAFRKWIALAACMVLVISLAGTAIVVDAMEYNAAVEFFEDYGLSMDGLSRSDVKAIFKDITTAHFTYDKTAHVICEAVPGVEISQKEPTPEKLSKIWAQTNIALLSNNSGTGIRFNTVSDFRYEEHVGDVEYKKVLECYHDRVLLWSLDLPEGLECDRAITFCGTVLWGYTDGFLRESMEEETDFSTEPHYASIALVDGNGRLLWQRDLDHGFRHENIDAVLDNKDGTFAVISSGGESADGTYNYLCLSQFDASGNELSFCRTEVSDPLTKKAIRLGDGYLLQLGQDRLVKLDRQGRLLESFAYDLEDCSYKITDMIEFGGKVYLSTYAIPKHSDGELLPGLADALNPIFADRDKWNKYDETLTALVRDNYTAVLLLCDPDSGTPDTFCSVKGAMGARLKINDANELEWNVEYVASTFFAPDDDSYKIGGTCQVFCYTFDEDGKLIRGSDTGKFSEFSRLRSLS